MSEVSDLGSVNAGHRSQIVGCSKRVELRSGVGWLSPERHVTAILGQHDSISGAGLYIAGPFCLPHREVGISVKAEKNTERSSRIADNKAREELAIRSVVMHTACLAGNFMETGRLEEDLLLRLPEKRQQAEQQPERD